MGAARSTSGSGTSDTTWEHLSGPVRPSRRSRSDRVRHWLRITDIFRCYCGPRAVARYCCGVPTRSSIRGSCPITWRCVRTWTRWSRASSLWWPWRGRRRFAGTAAVCITYRSRGAWPYRSTRTPTGSAWSGTIPSPSTIRWARPRWAHAGTRRPWSTRSSACTASRVCAWPTRPSCPRWSAPTPTRRSSWSPKRRPTWSRKRGSRADDCPQPVVCFFAPAHPIALNAHDCPEQYSHSAGPMRTCWFIETSVGLYDRGHSDRFDDRIAGRVACTERLENCRTLHLSSATVFGPAAV